MKNACVLLLALAIPAVTGCAGDDGTDSQTNDSTATQYVGVSDFNNAQFQDVIYDLRNKLNGEFDQVCGDTFCGGDYGNIVGMSLNCSVTSVRGDIHECAWTFSGSQQYVNPNTAALQIDAVTFACHFKATGTASKFFDTMMNSPNALRQTLPGKTTTVYDALGDCFQHPIGKTPITIVQSDKPKYLEPLEYYTSASGQAKWEQAQAGLKKGFDNICGDTFCGGDFSDLQGLGFICAVTKSTGNIKSCAWSFGGSYSGVNTATGAVEVTSDNWVCPVPVKGTIGTLISTLNSAGDALQATLPGETTSTYDAIGNNCLP